ncbi:GDSL-type esterase/lipase family protein [Fulvivirgaceae bacterium BMA10]|uniref:GDSL-type esterase/lipase family protein n=1 Tax=Splendidivirga corallicola TaxID=3051826 RepID=A0ABT8KS02_9BACT|nr:GDSL-type esterase/lipase family protein [Fulvivirgaceae bacterium BMA10]
MSRICCIALLFSLVATGSLAQIKVACIGNSITYGAGVTNREKNAYPQQLQSILGNEYEVRNFGLNGATLLKKGNTPYWKTKEYTEALAYDADIIVIKLGTNDAKRVNLNYLDEFKSDYLSLIRSLKQENDHKRVIICLPVPIFENEMGKTLQQRIIPLIQEVAYESSVEIVNLYNIFLSKEHLFPDKVHPTSLGATIIAQRLYEQITLRKEDNFKLMEKLAIDGEKSNFHGFTETDFDWNGVACKIVEPKYTAIGRPWVLRARFWGHEPQTDVALLERGFHIAYCDVANLYGNKKAIERWNNFYNLMRQGGLGTKVVLEGMSRGGLIIYNWALENLEKVACIYADAPVLDGKSWPGGKGNGKYSEADWNRLKEAHEFKTEEEAISFKGFPIDRVKKIAKSKIPVLHVCGSTDQVVPVSENTKLFEEQMDDWGGDFRAIYKEDVGHHPHSLKDPTTIVNFILKSTNRKINFASLPVPGAEYRSAAGWKEGADWWANHEDIKHLLHHRENPLDILFIGNSITQSMGGNRQQVTIKTGRDTFDQVFEGYTWETAGISGDRTQHVAWRIKNGDYIKGQPKVVVLTIGVNNFAADAADEVTEGILKILNLIREHLPDSKILLLGPLPAGNESDHPYRRKYKSVHKGLLKEMKKRKDVLYMDMGEFLIAEDGKLNTNYYSRDGIHLIAGGYEQWALTIFPIIEKMIK